MAGVKHKSGFGLYIYDGFDHESSFIKAFQKLEKAIEYARKKYVKEWHGGGIDTLDIVDTKGNIVWQHR